MWWSIKNFFSYLWFVFSLDWFQVFSTVVDVAIMVWTIIKWEDIVSQPSLLFLVIAVFVNLIWQLFNVMSHFSFLKKEDPTLALESMIPMKLGVKDYSCIKIDSGLTLPNKEFHYSVNLEMGVLENEKITNLLLDDKIQILPQSCNTKREKTRTYVKHYKAILLKFLNQRWYEIQQKEGLFTNDLKICFAGEPYYDGEGVYKWGITKGRYYNGYLTNVIFAKYIGGSNYRLYPPMNMLIAPIKPLGSTDFSDHIGVSTLLLTKDNHVILFQQASNAGYNANRYMPTGSGSLDYADYKKDEDLRQVLIRGAERELAEESSIKKKMGKEEFSKHISTRVVGYYRDMERGGKPEFCCLSIIDRPLDAISDYIKPSEKEMAKNIVEPVHMSDQNKWDNVILPKASQSLKMNLFFIKCQISK